MGVGGKDEGIIRCVFQGKLTMLPASTFTTVTFFIMKGLCIQHSLKKKNFIENIGGGLFIRLSQE